MYLFIITIVLIHRKSNCTGYIDCGEPVPGSNTFTEVSSSSLLQLSVVCAINFMLSLYLF